MAPHPRRRLEAGDRNFRRAKFYFRFLLFLLAVSANTPVGSTKEAVIFEQIGQLARVTAYLHVHIELSISSVEAQLNKYRQLLHEHCSSEDAVVKFMSTFPEEDPNLPGRNFTIPSFTRPSATIRAQGKLWKKVADLHLRDLDDIEHHVSSLRNPLPPLPNRRKDQVYFKGTYSTVADETEKHLVGPYPDTFDHLLSLVDEPEGRRRPASRGLNIYDLYGDESSTTTTSTASLSKTQTESPSLSSTVANNYSEHTIVKMVSAGKSRGR
jgi:hypothetical protein